jgi:branched-chain amino acid transport system ATP-binding protein
LGDAVRPLLQAQNLVTGFGKRAVIHGVSLDVSSGEIVALIGHNGAGKSSLLKALFGLLPLWQGQVRLDGHILPAPEPRELLAAGVTYVPQGSRVFPDLSVRENLEVACFPLRGSTQRNAALESVLALFSPLKKWLQRRAGTLSGGEKQMLALASAFVLSPRLLLLDEPSLGLAPPLVTETLDQIQQVCRSSDVAALIVEQKVREVFKIAERVYVLRNGRVSFTGPTTALSNDDKLREVFL